MNHFTERNAEDPYSGSLVLVYHAVSLFTLLYMINQVLSGTVTMVSFTIDTCIEDSSNPV